MTPSVFHFGLGSDEGSYVELALRSEFEQVEDPRNRITGQRRDIEDTVDKAIESISVSV